MSVEAISGTLPAAATTSWAMAGTMAEQLKGSKMLGQALNYTQEHPIRIILGAAGLYLGPGGVLALPLRAIGFGALGPLAGSIAAYWQSTYYGGYVAAGSVFSILQWLGMTVGV
ncbi:hypothetical protein L228DRAFT_257911 [Xylona heveae TC161]|uniref:Uncharacterized protein n=1 Tax=Xylona heveae (strain CBS 132557 / TC161) TaxID=1328760 RepID=A0A165JPH8_XYLHT|nr:hypothetical protein L228DRAFT_257911 [Xylona heveae TC161]KZF26482.1 hypothetical protein L228DRAFT_257911 [Xylona heveae TC161]